MQAAVVGTAGSEAERLLGVVWDTALEALVLVDDGRAYRRVNRAAEELLGHEQAEILSRRIDDFTPPHALPVLERMWGELRDSGRLYGQYEVRRGDGQHVMIEFSAVTDVEPGRHLIAAREIGPRHPAPEEPEEAKADSPLSQRELEILRLAADGLSTGGIAATIVVSPGTVKSHFENIYEKLGVHDRAAAVAHALRRRLID